MSKPPRLDEVFLSQNRNLINVGSAYSLRRPVETPVSRSPLAGYIVRKNSRRAISEAEMKPELAKVVKKYVQQVMDCVPESDDRPVELPDEGEVEKILTAFAHELEGAEGEDPAELDQGGPAPGTTGGR